MRTIPPKVHSHALSNFAEKSRWSPLCAWSLPTSVKTFSQAPRAGAAHPPSEGKWKGNFPRQLVPFVARTSFHPWPEAAIGRPVLLPKAKAHSRQRDVAKPEE